MRTLLAVLAVGLSAPAQAEPVGCIPAKCPGGPQAGMPSDNTNNNSTPPTLPMTPTTPPPTNNTAPPPTSQTPGPGPKSGGGAPPSGTPGTGPAENGNTQIKPDLIAPPSVKGSFAGNDRSGGSHGVGVLEKIRAAAGADAPNRVSGSAASAHIYSANMKVGSASKMLDEKPAEMLRSAELTRVGKSQLAVGDFRGALSPLTEAVRLDPNNGEAWKRRAQALNKLGDFTQALAAAEQALRIDPEDAEGWSEAAWALYKQRRYQESVTAATRAIDLAPDRPEGYAVRARARYALGDREAAIADARLAAELDPRLKGLLAAMLAGDYSEAAEKLGAADASHVAGSAPHRAPDKRKAIAVGTGLGLLALAASLLWLRRREAKQVRTFSSLLPKNADPERTPSR